MLQFLGLPRAALNDANGENVTSVRGHHRRRLPWVMRTGYAVDQDQSVFLLFFQQPQELALLLLSESVRVGSCHRVYLLPCVACCLATSALRSAIGKAFHHSLPFHQVG